MQYYFNSFELFLAFGAFSTENKSCGCFNKKKETNICKDGKCDTDFCRDGCYMDCCKYGCCARVHKAESNKITDDTSKNEHIIINNMITDESKFTAYIQQQNDEHKQQMLDATK